MSPTPKALVLIADGTEEMEFTITYDTLVRGGIIATSAYVSTPPTSPSTSTATTVAAGGQGQVTLINPPTAKCSRGVRILPDIYFEPSGVGFGPDKYDLLVIPGGAKGAETMSNDAGVQKLVREYLDKGKYVGMICAGSLAAKTSNLPNQPLTSHPSVKAELDQSFAYSEDPVVVSGNLVTSRGPGTTFPFALTLVEMLVGPEKRKEITGPMIFPSNTPW
ncbi:DJ-1 [Macrolepiota fuliginosa MF-IS2]|uniref:D-lactate dehydratase n=1 Tax=Macrolepiota fuliginosa MF-IS2 TaxID=1400762 RepID=A0A9P5XPB5_9AGAR|nr:DJ-1 [Macrolepiota fuliginosa MF-IS2]